MKRRQFLKTAPAFVAVSLAGCSDSTTHTLGNDTWTQGSRDEGEYTTTVEGTITLDSGEYHARDIEFTGLMDVTIGLTVTDGDPVDVFFFDRDEYSDRYRDGEADEIHFWDALSTTETTDATLSTAVDAGEYTLVVDNSGVYGAAPDGSATIDLTIERSVPVEQVLADAQSSLGDAWEAIAEGSDPESANFNVELVAERLDAAEARLDAAERLDDGSHQESIASMRAMADWSDEMASAMESAKTGLNEIDTASAYFGNERFDDADATLDDASDAIENGQSSLQTARSEFGSVDASVIDGFERPTATAVMDSLDSLFETLAGFADGFQRLNAGMELFLEAADAYDAGEFETAIDPFQSARDEFASAESTFRDTEENAPQNIVEDMIDLTCIAESMKDATAHFAEASRAARDGDASRFEEEDAAGWEAMNRCE